MKKNQDEKKHDDRVNSIQEIAEEYYKDEIGEIPSLNKEFIERDQEAARKRSGVMRYVPIAATIVIVFIVGNIVAAITLEDPAYGNKGLLHRIYQSMRGIDTDEENENFENEVLEEAVITDWDDIDTAITFSEGALYIPEYIPREYNFKGLEMQNMSMGDFNATYTFKDGSNVLTIIEIYSKRSEEVSCTGDGELVRLDDRLIYIQEPDNEGNIYVNVYTENAIVQIMGLIAEDEAVNIAKSINISKK